MGMDTDPFSTGDGDGGDVADVDRQAHANPSVHNAGGNRNGQPDTVQ
jgi:hypothetical protein